MFVVCKQPAKRSFKAFPDMASAMKWAQKVQYKITDIHEAHGRVIVNYFVRLG